VCDVITASETWTLLKTATAKLEVFHVANQRQTLGIFWYEFVTYEEVDTFSQLLPVYEDKSEETLFLWSCQAYELGCSCSPSKRERENQHLGAWGIWAAFKSINVLEVLLKKMWNMV